jgi:hypothetical protein
MQALLEVRYDNGKGSLIAMSPAFPTLPPAVQPGGADLLMGLAKSKTAEEERHG